MHIGNETMESMKLLLQWADSGVQNWPPPPLMQMSLTWSDNRAVTALDVLAVQDKTATEDLLPEREFVCDGTVWYVGYSLSLSSSVPFSGRL